MRKNKSTLGWQILAIMSASVWRISSKVSFSTYKIYSRLWIMTGKKLFTESLTSLKCRQIRGWLWETNWQLNKTKNSLKFCIFPCIYLFSVQLLYWLLYVCTCSSHLLKTACPVNVCAGLWMWSVIIWGQGVWPCVATQAWSLHKHCAFKESETMLHVCFFTHIF